MPDHMVFAAEPDASLLPANRECLKELADGGAPRAAYLSTDRSETWLVVRGNGLTRPETRWSRCPSTLTRRSGRVDSNVRRAGPRVR